MPASLFVRVHVFMSMCANVYMFYAKPLDIPTLLFQ